MRIITIVLAALMALFMMSVAGTAMAQPTQVPPGPPEGLPPEDGTPPENPGPPTGVGTPIASLSGSAFWQGGQLTIDARVLPNGMVQGTQTWVPDGASGYVLEVVPPSTEVDYWCISVRRTDPATEGRPPSNVNWYVRDSGDGVTTFDEVSLATGSADSMTCTTFRDAPGLFPVREGDFQGNY